MKNLKKLFVLAFISSFLIMTGCAELEEVNEALDEAEPCEEEIRTTIPSFSSQDLSSCSDIKTMTLDETVEEESPNEIGRYLIYQFTDINNEVFPEILHVIEFTTCNLANSWYDTLESGSTSENDPEVPSNISSIYDEAYLDGTDEFVREFYGRIDNIVLRFYVKLFECSNDPETIIELCNKVGARASN